MKNNKRYYTRMERIRFYCKLINSQIAEGSNPEIEKALERLEYLTSERFQEWNGRVQQQVTEKIKEIAEKKETA